MVNLAGAVVAIAGAVPDRDALIWRDRHLSWASLADRIRRFAGHLDDRGLGRRAPDDAVAPWESPHDHVALWMTNCDEYLVAMLGCFAARVAPVNLNYRYTAAEAAGVLVDAGARGVVIHRRYLPVLAEARRLAGGPLDDLLVWWIEDGSEADPPSGSVPFTAGLGAAPRDVDDLTPADRYLLYTGGTTGSPKGVIWRQGDFAVTALGIDRDTGALVERAARRPGPRAVPSAPFMHGAAHWNALSALLAGGTVIIPDRPERFDPADVCATIERHGATALQIVGDPFARPLLEELDRGRWRLPTLKVITSGGAVLSAAVRRRLRDHLPGVRIIDIMGSSESGRQAMATTDDDPGDATSGEGAFRPEPTTVVLDASRSRVLAPGEPEVGWLAQRGRVPLGYLGDPEKTAATFPVIDGERYVVPGDRAVHLADGRVRVLGRDSVTINTGGEKVFAEEVERALASHPAVDDVVVVGRPHPRWGQEVVAVVSLRPGTEVTDPELVGHAAASLARYKLPKAVVRVRSVKRSPAGKPDYAWARAVAAGDTNA